MIRQIALSVIVLLAWAGSLPAEETIVFRGGEDGYHTYRIPALIVSPKGALLAFIEGRKTGRGDAGDIDLLVKRSEDGGKTWSKQQLVHEEGGSEKITIGNPCPVVDAGTGVIWLPLTRNNDRVLMTQSKDDGQTWSQPEDITATTKLPNWSWYATGPGNGIQLLHGKHKGRLLIPCDHRVKDEPKRELSTRSHVIYSDDHGKTWQLGGLQPAGTNECAVAELDDGTLVLNMRSYRGKKQRAISRSMDGGNTWSETENDPNLIEPICEASLIRIRSLQGKPVNWLAFSNPADQQARRNLTLRLSSDGGKTWPAQQVLCEGSSIYSSLAELPNDELGVLYERNDYKEVVFTRVAISSLSWK